MKVGNVSNHDLTREQIIGLAKMFGEVQIIHLPLRLEKDWANLNPDDYSEVVHQIVEWMKENEINYIHLAGFAPAVVQLVNTIGRTKCLYSFSERISEEKEVDGKVVKTSIFKHRGWYNY